MKGMAQEMVNIINRSFEVRAVAAGGGLALPSRSAPIAR